MDCPGIGLCASSHEVAVPGYIITCHTQTLGWDLIGCGDQVQVWDCKGKHAPEPRVDSAIVENLTDAAPVWRRGTQAL